MPPSILDAHIKLYVYLYTNHKHSCTNQNVPKEIRHKQVEEIITKLRNMMLK